LGPGIWLWQIDGSPFVGELLSRSELCGVEYTTFIPRIQYFCCDLHDFCGALKLCCAGGLGPHVSPCTCVRQVTEWLGQEGICEWDSRLCALAVIEQLRVEESGARCGWGLRTTTQ
jgi:hypothetical protein